MNNLVLKQFSSYIAQYLEHIMYFVFMHSNFIRTRHFRTCAVGSYLRDISENESVCLSTVIESIENHASVKRHMLQVAVKRHGISIESFGSFINVLLS